MNLIFLALLALMAVSANSVSIDSADEDEEAADIGGELYESRAPIEWVDEDRHDDDGEGDGYSPVKRDLGDFDEYTIQTRPEKFHHNFGELLNYSLLFFEAQKSGNITKSEQKLPWRASSCLSDSGLEGEDLTGGWYDAGDNVKFNFPMAFSSSVLAWSLIEFPDAYQDAGVYNDMLSALEGVCEYFTKCHTGPNEYFYQVADADLDHRFWQRPEDIVYYREPFRVNDIVPGSDVVSLAAAALATCSVAYKDAGKGNQARIFRLEAMDLYRFATTNIGTYPSNGYYINNQIGDELLWAATWLHLATGEEEYLQDAEGYFEQYKLKERAYSFGWEDTREGSKLLLYKITGKMTYKDSFMQYMDTLLPMNSPDMYTDEGLYFRNERGSLPYAAGASFVGLVAAKYGLRPNVYREFACNQTNYMLGDNTRRSYVVGYGVNPPCRPHHRASSCPELHIPCTNTNSWENPDCNHHVLIGALVGGPNKNDEWVDDRKDYIHNKVACDYNAVFQGTISGLAQASIDGQLPPACYVLSHEL